MQQYEMQEGGSPRTQEDIPRSPFMTTHIREPTHLSMSSSYSVSIRKKYGITLALAAHTEGKKLGSHCVGQGRRGCDAGKDEERGSG